MNERDKERAKELATRTRDDAAALVTGARATVESARRLLRDREEDLARAERNLYSSNALLELVEGS